MKLSPLTIIVVGISVMFAAAMVTLSIFLPNVEDAKNQNTLANKLIEQANQQEAANKKVEQAIADVQKMAEEWQKVVAVKTPRGINMHANRWQMTNDAVSFRNQMQRALNAQIKRGGVVVVNGPRIPDPPANASQIVEYFNYPAIRFPVLIFDLGQVSVRGTYAQITENMRAWTNMPNYLAVADGLQLTGTTPTMTGTYNLTIVAYIRGDLVAPPVPESGGGGGGGGGAGPGVPGGPNRGGGGTPTAAAK